MPAAAIVGAGVLAAGATIYASNKASHATSSAANTASNVQLQALAQQKEMAAPYTALGQQAIPTLENLLGIAPKGKPGAPAGPTPQQTLSQLPGYQFAKQQGIDATKAGAASMGMALSGNTLEGISNFTTGLADQTYGAEVNRLMQIAGLGESAATGTATNIGNTASNLSNIAVGQGNNQASIYANEAAGISGALGNTAGSLMLNNTLANLNKTPATAGSGYTDATVPAVPAIPQINSTAGLGTVPNSGIV
jgi:hypothetical protein